MQHQRLCHENVVSPLAEIDGRHPGRLPPGEALQELGKEHEGHSCTERGGDAATATDAEHYVRKHRFVTGTDGPSVTGLATVTVIGLQMTV